MVEDKRGEDSEEDAAFFAKHPKHRIFRVMRESADSEEVRNAFKDAQELFRDVLLPGLSSAAKDHGVVIYKKTSREKRIFPALDQVKRRALNWMRQRSKMRKQNDRPPEFPNGLK